MKVLNKYVIAIVWLLLSFQLFSQLSKPKEKEKITVTEPKKQSSATKTNSIKQEPKKVEVKVNNFNIEVSSELTKKQGELSFQLTVRGALEVFTGLANYKGELENNKPNGIGIAYTADKKYKYEGDFKDGRPDGTGKLINLITGSEYTGQFWNGGFDGIGTYIYKGTEAVYNCKNIVMFEGSWRAGNFDAGKCFDKNDNLIYEGRFSEFKPIEIYPNRQMYFLDSKFKVDNSNYNGNISLNPDKTKILVSNKLYDFKNGDIIEDYGSYSGLSLFSVKDEMIFTEKSDKSENCSYLIKSVNKDLKYKLTFKKFEMWNKISAISFSNDGEHIVKGDINGILRMWNTSNGKIHSEFHGKESRISKIVFSFDNKQFATTGGNSVNIWNSSDCSHYKTISTTTGVSSISYSADNKSIIVGLQNKTIEIFDIETGKQIRSIANFSNDVNNIIARPDKKVYVTTSGDSIQIWLADSWLLAQTIKGSGSAIQSVCFTGDGKYLISLDRVENLAKWKLFE